MSQAPNEHGHAQSNLRHFKKRWDERYGDTIGEFSRELRQAILDKIYYGESEWVRFSQQGRRLLAVHAVEVNGHTAFVLYDERHHDLFSAVPVEASYVRRYIAHKNYLDREARRQAAGVSNTWNTVKGKAKKRVAKKSGVMYL